VRNPGERIRPRRGLIQKHSQHARLAATEELDFDDFEPAGGRYPLRDFPHTFNVKRHVSNSLQAMAATTEGTQTKKWACAHWCASPNAGSTQQFSVT
jgi:hypothetical protein